MCSIANKQNYMVTVLIFGLKAVNLHNSVPFLYYYCTHDLILYLYITLPNIKCADTLLL